MCAFLPSSLPPAKKIPPIYASKSLILSQTGKFCFCYTCFCRSFALEFCLAFSCPDNLVFLGFLIFFLLNVLSVHDKQLSPNLQRFPNEILLTFHSCVMLYIHPFKMYRPIIFSLFSFTTIMTNFRIFSNLLPNHSHSHSPQILLALESTKLKDPYIRLFWTLHINKSM